MILVNINKYQREKKKTYKDQNKKISNPLNKKKVLKGIQNVEEHKPGTNISWSQTRYEPTLTQAAAHARQTLHIKVQISSWGRQRQRAVKNARYITQRNGAAHNTP